MSQEPSYPSHYNIPAPIKYLIHEYLVQSIKRKNMLHIVHFGTEIILLSNTTKGKWQNDMSILHIYQKIKTGFVSCSAMEWTEALCMLREHSATDLQSWAGNDALPQDTCIKNKLSADHTGPLPASRHLSQLRSFI